MFSTTTSQLNRQMIQATMHFSLALLTAELKNIQSLMINLGLPIFMLLSFWLPSIGAQGEEAEVLLLMFPAIATLGVLMPGHIQATRLTRWREQGLFARLMLTPVPLPNLIFGAVLVPVSLGVILGMIMLVLAVPITGITLSASTLLAAFGVILLVSVTFTALGSLLAVFTDRSDIAGYAYFFVLIPLFFLGSFPSSMLPSLLNQFTPWLPTTMAVQSVNALLMGETLASGNLLGLSIYALLFMGLALRLFRWEK